MSVAPAAEIGSEVAFSHPDDPPLAVGVVGAVRSSRTVPPMTVGTGVHAETLPALSMLWYSTSVSPSAGTFSELPATGADQVAPPSVDVRC